MIFSTAAVAAMMKICHDTSSDVNESKTPTIQ